MKVLLEQKCLHCNKWSPGLAKDGICYWCGKEKDTFPWGKVLRNGLIIGGLIAIWVAVFHGHPTV